MKKYILLLFTTLSFAQASNQMVTFTQAQSLGFTLKAGQSHVTSNQCMTKTEALAKYNLDANAMSSYASNQLVPKSVWVSDIVGMPYFTDNYSFSSNAQVCSYVGSTPTTRYTISGLAIGQKTYYDEKCTSVNYVGSSPSFYRGIENGVKKAFSTDLDGVITQLYICP